MNRTTLSLLFLLCLVMNAMAAEQADSLMGLTGGIFDSFTGAPIEAKACLLREDSTIVKQPSRKNDAPVDTLEVMVREDWQTKRQMTRYYGRMPKQKGNYILKAEHEDYETLFVPFTVNKIRATYIDGPDLKMKRVIHKSVDLDEVVSKLRKCRWSIVAILSCMMPQRSCFLKVVCSMD